MREILFRGKRTDNGEWAEGQYIAAHHHWHNRGIHKDWIVSAACANGGWFALHGRHPVVAGTVGQCTGWTDKNGKRIFEGDIIAFPDTGEDGYEYKEGYDFTNVATVCWNNGRWELEDFGDENSGVKDDMDDWHEDFIGIFPLSEVIGNIHDNPELMGGDFNGSEQQTEGCEI